MVILKKIKASTLMETLVASVLIVVIFMIASMILNNVFSNAVKNDTNDIETNINELEYLYKNDKLALPYYDTFESWEVTVKVIKEYDNSLVSFEATKPYSSQTYSRQIHVNQ